MCRSGNTLSALASILNKAGSAALTAQTAVDAWEIVRKGAAGCVVLDVTQLTHDALGLFRACRSSRNSFTIPFLFLTTDNCISPKFEGVWPETARDAWLALPCPAPQFLSAIRNLLAANVPPPLAPIQMDDAIETEGSKAPTARNLIPVRTSRRSGTGIYTATPSRANFPVTGNGDNAPDTLFTGKLGTLQFSQILGLIEPLRLTGTLKINDGVRAGDVYFVDGRVHHAELNEIEGSEALFLLFHLSKGSFQFDVGPATQRRTVEGNTMGLLLEGMRKMDEAKASISALKERQNTGAYASVR